MATAQGRGRADHPFGQRHHPCRETNPGGLFFQIWFDPNLQESLGKPATYDNYRDGDFPIAEENGLKITTFIGPDGPLTMETPVRARRFDLS